MPCHLRAGEIDRLPFLQSCIGLAGWNLTMPHKEEIIPLLAEIDPAAAKIASVNTVVVTDQGWHGYSADGLGFLRSLADAGFSPAGKRVVLLGAGGAGRAVAHALAEEGAAKITIMNRNLKRGETLAQSVGAVAEAKPWGDWPSLAECDLLINTTPQGMHGVTGDFDDFSFLRFLPRDAMVADLIYHPAETQLLAAAKTCGLGPINGLGMLVHQAILTFYYFWGVMPGEKETAAIFSALEKEKGYVRL